MKGETDEPWRSGSNETEWSTWEDTSLSSVKIKTKKSNYTMLKMTVKRTDVVFNLAVYDFIAFDLDNTLVTYNLRNLFKNHFKYLSDYLAKKGYDVVSRPSPTDVDFMSRGLIVDIARGNLLKVSPDGRIGRASNGTRPLFPDDVAELYGADRKWPQLSQAIAGRFADWKSRSAEMYSFMDFTDSAATAVYALAVDTGRPPRQTWSDVYEALAAMYSDSDWENDLLNVNAERYFNKTPKKVIDWLMELRKRSKIGLITSNYANLAPQIAKNGLGPEWRSLFDVIVYEAKKPDFFNRVAPFKVPGTGNETEFNFGSSFTGGSMTEIRGDLEKTLNRKAKILYIGDSPFHDYMTASNSDSVAISEELKAEGFFPGGHPSEEFVRSTFWGSYFFENGQPTLFGKFVLDSTFCAPDLEFFADKPVDFEYSKVELLNK